MPILGIPQGNVNDWQFVLGPDGQDREAHPKFRAHLEGRVGFVETINATKGMRLRKIFNKIEWS
jgi:hypothetical protein